MNSGGYVCVMLRAHDSATFDQLLAVAEEVFDLPPEHAAALAQGAQDGEETMVAIVPPRPARALVVAAEAWAAERGAPLSFRLSPVADAFTGLTSAERAKRSYRAPADPFAAWRRSFAPSLLGITLLLPSSWLLWRAGAAGESLLLLAAALVVGAITGWLWQQRRHDSRRPLPLVGLPSRSSGHSIGPTCSDGSAATKVLLCRAYGPRDCRPSSSRPFPLAHRYSSQMRLLPVSSLPALGRPSVTSRHSEKPRSRERWTLFAVAAAPCHCALKTSTTRCTHAAPG